MHKYQKLTFLTLSLLFLLATQLPGQEYDSAYTTKSGVKGHATFDYYYDLDHLLVKNGDFKFKSDVKDSFPTSVFEELMIDGEYSENKKIKNWSYELTRREVEILEIEDDRLVYELNTYRTKILGAYEKGVPSGEWTIKTNWINDKSEQKEVQSTTIQLRRGFANGSLSHSSTNKEGVISQVEGQFENGFFIGDWTFTTTSDNQSHTELRHYNKGVLEYTLTNGDTLTYPLSPLTTGILDGTARGEQVKSPISIEFNEGYPSASIYLKFQRPGNKLLAGIQNQLLQFDADVLQKQGVIFGAARSIFPLTTEEEELISEWNEAETLFQNEVTRVKEHEIKDFGSSQDSIAVISLDWIEQQEDLIETLSPLSQIFLSGEAEYYYRDGLLLENAISLLDSDTLTYNRQQYIVDYPTPAESKSSLLSYLVENYSARINIAQRIDQFLSELQTSASLEDELAALPLLIDKEKKLIDSLYSQEHSEATDEFLTQVSSKFFKGQITDAEERFEAMEDSEEKKSLGDSILINLNTLNRIHQEALRIETRSDFVDSLYTEFVFDAFTFSDIEARVKKRLYEQVIDIQDELIKDAIRADNPKVTLDFLEEVYRAQGALIFLRDRKTRPLERSLARAKGLPEKLELLHEAF